MFKLKKIAAVGLAVLTVGALSVTAFAVSNYDSPAEAAAGLTGRTLDSVVEERSDTGKTYGEIAGEAGALDEFEAEVLEMKKDYLNEKVAAGEMTQEEADEILAAIEANQETCDGSGGGVGMLFGAGFGSNGGGFGTCTGLGEGGGYQGRNGMGGNGQGACSGLCLEDDVSE